MNGLLLVDKPGGMTSHDVVARVRRLTGEKSVGHLGTLDPMATGLLPLLLGNYTRLARFFGSLEKHYTGSIRFGFATDTYDAEGVATTPPMPVAFTLEEVRVAAAGFHGETEQMPPPYSAKKIAGKPAYKLARAGETPLLKAARVTIAHFSLDELDGDTVAFAMQISSGGYVRSVAHELGQKLGCGAHLSSLRRTAAGPFRVEETITLEALQQAAGVEAMAAHLLHPRTLLPELPSVTADASTLAHLRNGMQVNLPEFSRAAQVKVFASQTELAAIARRLAGTLFQPEVVLSTS
jgi:tRNA pseudouridine55 synthase